MWVCGKPYYLYRQDFRNYEVGLLLDLTKTAERIEGNSILEGSSLYLSDGVTELLFPPAQEPFQLTEKESDELFQKGMRMACSVLTVWH